MLYSRLLSYRCCLYSLSFVMLVSFVCGNVLRFNAWCGEPCFSVRFVTVLVQQFDLLGVGLVAGGVCAFAATTTAAAATTASTTALAFGCRLTLGFAKGCGGLLLNRNCQILLVDRRDILSIRTSCRCLATTAGAPVGYARI